MNTKKYSLSLDGDTFKELKNDFDSVLGRLITEMTKRESEEAKVTVSLTVKLTPGQARDFQANGYDGTRDITKPKFEHNIKSVMQVKDEQSGSCGGNYELAYDNDIGKWVMKEIYNGQTSMFDDEFGPAEAADNPDVINEEDIIDADYVALPAPEPIGLPAPAEVPESVGDEIVDEYRDKERHEEFMYAMKYVGEEMHILDGGGIYSVRTVRGNNIFLTSAGPEDATFHINADICKDHVGHNLTLYRDLDVSGNPYMIYLECEECDKTLWSFSIDTEGDYEYDPPEV